MTRMLTFALLAALAAVLLAGCSSNAEVQFTDNEMDKLKNPSKELPPQLADTMKYAAEDTKKKMAESQKNLPNVPAKR